MLSNLQKFELHCNLATESNIYRAPNEAKVRLNMPSGSYVFSEFSTLGSQIAQTWQFCHSGAHHTLLAPSVHHGW